MNKRGVNFECIRRWPVINLDTLTHRYSYLISLHIVLGEEFSMNSGQFRCNTKETRYHVSIAGHLMQNLWSQVAELVRRPRTMVKILYFRGGHQFFQISLGIKSLYDGGRKIIHLLAGEA